MAKIMNLLQGNNKKELTKLSINDLIGNGYVNRIKEIQDNARDAFVNNAVNAAYLKNPLAFTPSVPTNESDVKEPTPQIKAQKNKKTAESMAVTLYLVCSMKYLKDLNTPNLKEKYPKMFNVSSRVNQYFAPTRDNKNSESNASRSITAIERAKILVDENKLCFDDNQKGLIIKQLDKKLELLIN